MLEGIEKALSLANGIGEQPSKEFIAEVLRIVGPATEKMILAACGEIAGLRAEIAIWSLVAEGRVRFGVNGSGEAVFTAEKVV